MLFILATFFWVARLFASDSDLLTELEGRGILSAEEVRDIRKLGSSVEVIAPQSNKSFRIFTILQMRYGFIHRDFNFDAGGYKNKGEFNIRRFIPVFIADTTENSRFIISLFLPSSRVLNTAHYEIDIESKYICGKFMVGHNAVNFATEELESGSEIMTPDRSMLCMYFGGGDSGYDGYRKTKYGTCEGFSGYHTGVYWNGYIPNNKELQYGFALTNSKPLDCPDRYDNGLTFWLTLAYKKSFSKDFRIWTGANLGYADKLVSAAATDTLPSDIADCGDAWGANPFLRFYYHGFTLNAELMYTVLEYGASVRDDFPMYTKHSPNATPWGYYILGAYKLLDLGDWGVVEPVVRYSKIFTDGRGVRELDIIYNGSGCKTLFDTVESVYLGVNWYLRGNTLKYMLGYEHYFFKGSPNGTRAENLECGVFIGQFQVLF